MSLKKFDLAKNLALKLENQRKARGVPSRFAQGATEVLDKRERRARDAAAGLVPFACKLPGELVKQLGERAAAHEGGINAVVAELLASALAAGDASSGEPVAKKAAAKKVAAEKAVPETAVPEKAVQEKAASNDKASESASAKKAPAKKAAAKKTAS
jgi:hypothetical protein